MAPVTDPFHPLYFDQRDLGDELDRVGAVCAGCRACVERCEAFPRLFELLDGAAATGRHRLTPDEQQVVVDGCFDCGLCVLACPDAPGRSDRAIDVRQLLQRARELRHRDHPPPVTTRIAAGARRLVTRVSDPRPRTRFTTWMAQRSSSPNDGARPVVMFPTCHVEHHAPEIGRAGVGLLEQTGADCRVPSGLVCCGAPQLAAGDVAGFVASGRRNVRLLTEALGAHRSDRDGDAADRDRVEVVVPLPACAEILRSQYVRYVGGSDAELVAEATVDLAAHLLEHPPSMAEATSEPTGDAGAVTLHLPCRSRTAPADGAMAELLRRDGFEVTEVSGCLSPRAPQAVLAAAATEVAVAIGSRGDGLVSSACPTALGAIVASSTILSGHPMELLARHRGLLDN